MRTLTLEWHEGSQTRSQTLFSKSSPAESILIGRDREQCDLVLKDETNTVSRSHAEIIFDRREEEFLLAQPHPR